MNELILGTGPTSEPVTVSEAKAHLRVDVSDDDALITALIVAARQAFEEINGRSLFSTTWKLILDGWPACPYIVLPRPPLASVTSVAYTDDAGTVTTWAATNYVVETLRTPGRVHLAEGVDWPSVSLRGASPITITYVAGWATVGAIPRRYKQAVLLLVGHWYENRETVVTSGAIPKQLPMAFESLALMDKVW
jgi:uncharacterized phiE125 gp8 family phage protein